MFIVFSFSEDLKAKAPLERKLCCLYDLMTQLNNRPTKPTRAKNERLKIQNLYHGIMYHLYYGNIRDKVFPYEGFLLQKNLSQLRHLQLTSLINTIYPN